VCVCVCVCGQRHAVRRVTKYTSSGNAKTCNIQTCVKCTRVHTATKHASCWNGVTNIDLALCAKQEDLCICQVQQSWEKQLKTKTANTYHSIVLYESSRSC